MFSSSEFDVDLCVSVLNFQSNPKSNDLVNGITPQKLHVPCCSFTRKVSASKSQSGRGVPESEMPIFIYMFNDCIGNMKMNI